ncbi:MAG: DNA polymerase III subunit delta [Alphaproteobacteria bacterium]
MKVPSARIESFVKTPPSDLRIAVIFGPDAGAVRLYADSIARSAAADLNDPFRVALLQTDDISADPTLLHDEMAAMALGGGRRLVRVAEADDKLAAPLAKLLQDLPQTDSLLVIEAGDLDKRSKLRALAESAASQIAGLACYPEEGDARMRTIAGMLRERGIKIAPDALPRLAELTPPDRLGLVSELEKLSLYAGEAAAISLSDVEAALGDAAAADTDSLVLAVGDGDFAALDRSLRRLMAEAASPVALLRAAQRHFTRVLEVRIRIENGDSAKDAMNKLQPRVFWKYEAQFSRQAQKWSSAKIMRALAALTDAEAKCKRTGMPDAALCQQLFVTLARAA